MGRPSRPPPASRPRPPGSRHRGAEAPGGTPTTHPLTVHHYTIVQVFGMQARLATRCQKVLEGRSAGGAPPIAACNQSAEYRICPCTVWGAIGRPTDRVHTPPAGQHDRPQSNSTTQHGPSPPPPVTAAAAPGARGKRRRTVGPFCCLGSCCPPQPRPAWPWLGWAQQKERKKGVRSDKSMIHA